jgi:hypothetical protein
MKISKLLSFPAITCLLSVAPLLIDELPGISTGATAGAANAIRLVLDDVDPARYGWRYEGVNSHKSSIIYSYTGDGKARDLHLTAYDVDLTNELKIYLNGTYIGSIATGPNNGHTAAQIIELPLARQQVGENLLEIREKKAGWVWGVTSVGLFDEGAGALDSAVALAINAEDPAKYGWRYEGINSHKSSIIYSYSGDGKARDLHLTAYDVDLTNELKIYLNGTYISSIATGPNNGHTAAQIIELPLALQQVGENLLEIREKKAGWIWGVTDVGLFDIDYTGGPFPSRNEIVFSAEAPQDGLYCLGLSALNSNIYTAEPIESAEWQSRLDDAGWSITNMGKDVAWFADASARICFYAEGLGGHRYANANIYKVRAVESGVGVSMAERAGIAPATTAPAGETFADEVKFEQDNSYLPALHHDTDDDFWYAGLVHTIRSGSETLLETFATPGAAAGAASLQVNLMGGNSIAGETHVARIKINAVTVGQATWSGIAPKALQADFDSGILNAGADNNFELIIESAGRSVIWLNSFTVSFQRNFIAVDGVLRLRDDNNNQLVTVSGLSGPAVYLLDLSDPKRAEHVHAVNVEACGGGYCASFTSTAPDVEYLLAEQGVEPVIMLDQPTSTEEGEYVIIAPESLMQGARYLQDYRESEYSTVIKTLGQIYDEENFGIAHPDAIRSFLERAYASWSEKPRFVTVLGKSTIDPLDHLGYGTGLVPAHMVNTPSGLYVASVNSFADFNADGVPEIAIGHLPAVDSAEVSDYVDNKLRPFEASVGNRPDSLLAADDDGAGNPYHSRSDEIASLLATLGGNIDSAYHHTGDPISVAQEALFSRLNAGVSYFNYKGHGSIMGMTTEGLLRVSDLSGTPPRLSNAGQQTPVLGSFTCYNANGSYPGYDSLVEELLFSDSGVAGALASTGPSDNVQSHWLNKGFVKAGFHADATSTTLGEAAIEGLREMEKQSGVMDFMAPIYGVFGDPAMKIN